MIRDLFLSLKILPQRTWAGFVLSKDPIYAKIPESKRGEYLDQAIEYGNKEADHLLKTYDVMTPEGYARSLGLRIHSKQTSSNFVRMMGSFTQPDTITIYEDSVSRVCAVIKENGIEDLFEDFSPRQTVIAHEIFHSRELASENAMIHKKSILLWRLFGYSHYSSIVKLGEVAAFSFASRLMNLSYSPNIIDAMIVLAFYPGSFEGYCKRILSFA